MPETYDITYDGDVIGKAVMGKVGLYYHFSCRCRLPDEDLYRIHAIGGNNRTDLGICIPIDGMFGMDKKLSAKQLAQDITAFELIPRDWKDGEPEMDEQQEIETLNETEIAEAEAPEEGEFVAVSEEMPFDYLDRLDRAVMEIRDDEVGILLQNEE